MGVAYPPGLPLPLVTGYTNQDGEYIRIDKVEAGFFDVGLPSSQMPAFFNVKWTLDATDAQVLEGFYYHELLNGAKSMTMQAQVGMGLVDHDFYFDGTYKMTLVGKKKQFTAKLIAVQKAYDTEADFNTAKTALAS